MQLFHCDTEPLIHSWTLTITDDRINYQCRHVLRMRPGKPSVFQRWNTRWHCQLSEYAGDTKIHTTRRSIHIHETTQTQPNQHALRLAMLNKWDKVELVAQKVAECGLGSLYLFPAHRSIITQPNQKKMERLTLIAREASEQSRNRSIATIQRHHAPPSWYQHVIAQQWWLRVHERKQQIQGDNPTCLRIWPEWGWDEHDAIDGYTHVSLGSSILRADTAAIIGGWMLST